MSLKQYHSSSLSPGSLRSVENTTDSEVGYVQVRVRGYDTDGNQLDSYLNNTQDLSAGGTWAFSVPILDAEDFEDYDIQVSDSAF